MKKILLFALVLWAISGLAQIPTEGLVAYYPFNGNANDESGHGANGIVKDAILTTDRFGSENSAYKFIGMKSSYIKCPADSLPANDRTICLWFYWDTTEVKTCVMGYGGNPCGCSMIFNLGNPATGGPNWETQGHCGTNRLTIPWITEPKYNWYFWSVSIKGDTIRMYVNDELMGSNTSFGNITNVTGKDLLIGIVVDPNGVGPYVDANGSYFNGKIDDVRIYNRALSEEDIHQIYIEDNIIITSISNNSFFPGESFTADFSVMRPINEGNTFSLQLSNGAGSFINPRVIGSLPGTTGGTISATLPVNLSPDCGYRLRIAADNPGFTGLPSESTISVLSATSNPGDYMLQFDGIDDYVDLGTWFNQSSFTLSFWVNPDSVQQPGAAIADIQNDLILYSNPDVQGNYILSHLLQFDLLPKKWNHITITMDGQTSTRKLYLFGQLIDENQWNYSPQSGYNFKLGHGGFAGPNTYFKGQIDEVKLWDTIISPDQILLNVNKKLTGNEDGLLGYWDFNNGCSSVATDLTPNQHDGTLVNGLAKALSTVPNVGQQIIPNKAGNTNISTIKIYDNLFQNGSIAMLSGNSHPDIFADTTIINADGSLATCSFDLTGKETGIYNVVLINPDETEKVYHDSFTIEEGTPADVWVNITGSNVVRNGRPFNFLVTYGNNGNVDAKGVLLFVLVPQSVDVSLGFVPLSPDSTLIFTDSLSFYYQIDSLNGVPYPAKVIPLFIPRISSNSVNAMTFTLNSVPDSPFEIQAWINDPLYQSPLKFLLGDCLDNIIGLSIGLYPPAGCIYAIADALLTPIVDGAVYLYDPYNSQSIYYELNKHQVSFTLLLAKDLMLSSVSCIPEGAVVGLTKVILENMANFEGTRKAINSCVVFSPPKPPEEDNVKPIGSFDPNKKVGPEKYHRSNSPFNYSILFENVDTATAPAQEVTVIDSLDLTKFDLSSFSFGFYGFGDTATSSTYQLQREFSKFIDLRPAANLIAKTEGRLDTAKGIVYWKFTSLDPATMELTTDPWLGFLPPDDSTGRGEGWVSYNVRPFSTLSTGTAIQNRATIVFDYNTPISTNIYSNVIDDIRPLSNIQPLNITQADSSFVVQWSGTDVGSGIKFYNIYFADGTNDFILWKYCTSGMADIFQGHPNHHYSFYSLAIDSANNIENDTLPIVSTTVQTGIPELSGHQDIVIYQNYPNPFSDYTTIEYYLPNSQTIIIKITDICGRIIETFNNPPNKQGLNKVIFTNNNLSPGIYFYQLNAGQKNQTKMMMIN